MSKSEPLAASASSNTAEQPEVPLLQRLTEVKISATGESLPDDATEYAAVLIPELGIKFANHDLAGGTDEDGDLNEEESNAALAKLSEQNFAGSNNWRLESRLEADVRYYLTRMRGDSFITDVKNGWYRTGDVTPWSSDRVFFVGFGYGGVYYGLRGLRGFVRAVCSVPAGQ